MQYYIVATIYKRLSLKHKNNSKVWEVIRHTIGNSWSEPTLVHWNTEDEPTWKWIKHRDTWHCCQLLHTFCTRSSVQGQGYLLARLLFSCRSIRDANYTTLRKRHRSKWIQLSVQTGGLISTLLRFLLRLICDSVQTVYDAVLWRDDHSMNIRGEHEETEKYLLQKSIHTAIRHSHFQTVQKLRAHAKDIG